ncbi:MAG: DUF1801 domain-containing protein [Planctomyces sp.]|nr:DUF1801 domain-containing protein [Planctomyces sp.]
MAKKKIASERKSGDRKAGSAGSTKSTTARPSIREKQSAVARRSAEAQLHDLIDRFASDHSALVTAVRKWLRRRLPTAHEVIYEYRDFLVISFSPSGHGYEGVLAIRAGAAGVKLYFNRGKELSDPGRLLQGSGKLARSINIENKSTLTRPEIGQLVDEAIAGNSVPFEPAGRGSVSMSQSSSR